MPFPNVGIVDLFDRADAIDVGAAWSKDIAAVGDISFGITANRAGYFSATTPPPPGGTGGGGSGGWVVAAPGSTGQAVQTINNAPGLGVNVTTQQAIHDIALNGSGDSAVLFQLNAGGSTADRLSLLNVASLNAVSYGKHGIYAKAQNLTLRDIDITCSGAAASGLSMREAGLLAQRFTIGRSGSGRPPIALSYYETVSTEGTVTCEHMIVYCSDTVIWLSYDTDTSSVHQNFVFRDIQAFGPAWFLRVDRTFGPGLKAGKTITLDTCSMNGVRITSANLGSYVDLSTVSSGAFTVL